MSTVASDSSRGTANVTENTNRTIQRVNPAPLAFGAFAGTTFLLSWVNAGLIDDAGLDSAVATAWIFGGLIQILVASWHLRNEDLFPAVTFGSFGAFWLSFALLDTLYLDTIPPELHGPVTALFLTPWAVFSLYMLVGALRTNIAIVIAFGLVEITLIPLIIGNATETQAAVIAGGWAGIALAIIVWYIAAAEVLNHQFHRTVLPLGDLSRAH